MSEELKACPFCDGLNISMFYWDNALVWKIVCLNCGCEKLNVDKLFLIRWWNTRPLEDALRKQLEGMESDYESACVLVAKMHEAAVGGIRGPIAGVVEDVLNLRTKLDVAVKALRDDVLILLHEIQSSQKGSIGSIDNTYLPQMSRRNIDAMEKRINKALAEIEKGSD
jgi:hypothetical protein